MKGLIIRSPWIENILSGKKTWEIRGQSTNIRGEIWLIRSGSGTILGSVELIDCMELDFETYKKAFRHHGINSAEIEALPYKKTYAWVLKNPVTFVEPIKYHHPNGAIIWVDLKKGTTL